MQFIGIGDLHLDKLDNLVEDVTNKIMKSVRRVLNYALENGVRVVIFYGDICENTLMSYDAQCAFMSTVLAPKFRDLDIHIIPGNHDFAETGQHSLRVIETFANLAKMNFHVYSESTVVKLGKRKFHFMPHPVTETKRDCLNIGHFEVAGSYRDNGRRVDEGQNTKHAGCFGHLHTCHKVRRIHFSGTLYQTNFGESLPKSFHHVRYTDEDPYSAEVQNVPFEPLWKLINLTVNSERDLKQIVDDPDTLYKIFVQEGVDLDLGDVLREHPNIVRHNKFKSKEELVELIENEWDFATHSFVNQIDTEDVLTGYLVNKFKLNKRQVKKAFGFLDSVKQKSGTK